MEGWDDILHQFDRSRRSGPSLRIHSLFWRLFAGHDPWGKSGSYFDALWPRGLPWWTSEQITKSVDLRNWINYDALAVVENCKGSTRVSSLARLKQRACAELQRPPSFWRALFFFGAHSEAPSM